MEILDIVFGVAVLVMSVVVHEVSHGFVANFYGDPTARLAGRLTLNPIKHIDPVGSIVVPLVTFFTGGFVFGWARPVPFNPYNLRGGRFGPALVALAGPLSNFLVALFFALLVRIGFFFGFLPETFIMLAALVVHINILLGVFNLIPIPPIDGSKVLFAFLPYQFRGVETFLTRYSLFIILFLVFFGWRFLSPIIQSIVSFAFSVLL